MIFLRCLFGTLPTNRIKVNGEGGEAPVLGNCKGPEVAPKVLVFLDYLEKVMMMMMMMMMMHDDALATVPLSLKNISLMPNKNSFEDGLWTPRGGDC